MSEADVPLAQVRVELEKLGFRDLPEHLLVSFMQSILREEAVAQPISDSPAVAPPTINDTGDCRFLRSNGASSTQSASATLASAALKTRVSGRKVTIMSPSKVNQLDGRPAEVEEDQRLPLHRRLPQQGSDLQEQQRIPPLPIQQERHALPERTSIKSAKGPHFVQSTSRQEVDVFISLPSSNAPSFESAVPAAAATCGSLRAASDENTVPASERLEAANNALRAAIMCKSSSLKAHSSSSSVIYVSSAPSRPRSRHDPVKAFQNHASLAPVSPYPHISSLPPSSPSTGCRMGVHSSLAPVVCWPCGSAALRRCPPLAAVVACCKFRSAAARHAALATNCAQQVHRCTFPSHRDQQLQLQL